MNILGHSLISLNVFGKFGGVGGIGVKGENDLVIGALLPESCPFISDNPFTFDEIHEGGEKLLKFLKKKYPNRIGLALGMLSHSVSFGADSFNPVIEKYVTGERRENKTILGEIREATGVDDKTSKGLLHNFLWAGVDFWILEKYPDLVKQIAEAIIAVDYKTVGIMLAGCFGKDTVKSEKLVRVLFRDIYWPDDLFNHEGLARTWLRHSEKLKFDRQIDFGKTVLLIEKCQEFMKDEWEELVKEVETSVRSRMSGFTN